VVNKKLMAKNTFMLYGRMLLIMFATLYTSRMVLEALGVYDFGLYSLVGSIIILFSFIQNVSALATQRFLSVGLGKMDFSWTSKVFNVSIIVHLIICALIIIIAETVGLWFLLHKLKVPEARLDDIFWVYQISILSLLFQIMQTPFIAAMIACEKMDLFAKIGIFDAFQRWFMVFIFSVSVTENKIIWYAIFLLIGYFLVFSVYLKFCTSRLSICKINLRQKDSAGLLKEIFFFSSWSMLGSLSVVGLSQGIALLTYYFVGVVANGAVWLAEQVLIAFNRIIGTLQTAFNPQIIKQYTIGNHREVESLLSLSCKLTAFVVMVSAIPVFIDAKIIAGIWLNTPPEYLVGLIKIVAIYVLIDSMSGPYVTAIYAVGKLRNYQIIVSSIMLLSLVLTLILYSAGYSIYIAVSARIFCTLGLLIFRVIYVSKVIGVRVNRFLLYDFPRLVFVALVCIFFSHYCSYYIVGGFFGVVSLVLINLFVVLFMFSIIIVSKKERVNIIMMIKNRFKRV